MGSAVQGGWYPWAGLSWANGHMQTDTVTCAVKRRRGEADVQYVSKATWREFPSFNRHKSTHPFKSAHKGLARITKFPRVGDQIKFRGDFRLDTHPPTHITIG